jgi:hypothetical protein
MLLGRNRARPKCTVHSAAHYHVGHGPAWPQLARAWRTAALLDEARRRSGRGGVGAVTVRATAARARWSGRGGVGEAMAAARSAGRLSGGRGAVEAAVGTCGALSRQWL